MRLDDGCVRDVAERTGGFSFAYLKELTVSSLMAWVDDPVAGSMGAVMRVSTSSGVMPGAFMMIFTWVWAWVWPRVWAWPRLRLRRESA